MRRVIAWLTAAIVVTLMFGSAYVALQQLGRRSADAAPAAAAAAQVQLIGAETVSMPRLELTPDSGVFVLVYGDDDKPASGTVTLHGTLPLLPAGVLQTARESGADAVTWQPEPGLRMAVVARPAAGKVVVVAGQSLTPYEDRDRATMIVLALGWIGCILVLTAGCGSTEFLRRRRPLPTPSRP